MGEGKEDEDLKGTNRRQQNRKARNEKQGKMLRMERKGERRSSIHNTKA